MKFKGFEVTWKMALALGVLILLLVKGDDVLRSESFQALIGLFK